MTKKRIKFLIIFILIIPLTWYLKECSHRIGGLAGSFEKAEFYEIPISYRNLKEVLHDFKSENKDINLPSNLPWKDGKSSYWYYFTFYDKEKQRTFSTWIREADNNSSTFALVGTVYIADTTKFYNINRELNLIESYKFRKRFEELILNPVKEKLKHFVPTNVEPDTLVTFQRITNGMVDINLSLLKNKNFYLYIQTIPKTDEQPLTINSSGVWTKHNKWTRLTFLKNKPNLTTIFSFHEKYNPDICKIINDSTVDIVIDQGLYILDTEVDETNAL